MSSSLTITLCGEETSLQGTPLKSIEGLTATALLSEEKMSVSVMIQPMSVTEARWLFARLVNHLHQCFSIKKIELSDCSSTLGLNQDIYRAIALDLKTRSSENSSESSSEGSYEVIIHGDLSDEIDDLSCLEAGYRAWVDEDPTQRTSLKIAADVLEYAQENEAVEGYVLDQDELAQEGLELLLTVGGASTLSPPRLVVATYGHPSADAPPLMLVGKGITFDSGGINVKPYESFVSMMKNDMGGAALAWHLFKGLVQSQYPSPIVVVIPTCENPIGAQAMRPGSVVTGHRGVSVRVDHTDAEGRLILADALSWASTRYQPTEIITFATLTTAALISYGPFATPVHFASPNLQDALQTSSKRHGEDLHFFPYRVWHREANRDHEADLKNTGRLSGNARRGAGSRNAAHFLQFFTDSPLTHLDIFASTWDWSGQAVGTRHGATGSPLRTLLDGLRIYGDRYSLK